MRFSLGKFQKHLSPETILTVDTIFKQIEKVGRYPYYFPEYVLHGREHIQHVLEYAEQLIPDESLDYICGLNEDAINVLVLSVCLHDIAMFIDNYGFETLIKDKKWSDEFNKFIAILKKADDKILDKIYGSSHNTFSEEQNAKILLNRDNMFDKRNIYSVGEFIRKHHHEIAYDIAVNGFPHKDKRVDILNNTKYKKIIGFIAKAHRGNLRMIIEDAELEHVVYAEQGYSPYKIPIVYLMSILWIADEIDDKAEYRSPFSDMLDKELIPFSEQEWQDNKCMIDTTFVADKPVVFFHATPENTNQFLRVQSHCMKVQSAIDQSITAIVEYYGQKNTQLALSVIRVKSSLDNDKYNFLTVDASFRVNPGILNLLITPLYGYNPSFGVRELLSNALDACYERELVDMNYKGKAIILCNLNHYKKQFKIIDNGIGMTSEIIVNYFMTVGASIRNNIEWKLKYINENGHLSTPRLGRFGIGVLSAFLIGNKIEIKTRHYTSSKGYKFNISLNESIPNIEIIDCPIGTEITIDIPENMKFLPTSSVMWFFSTGDKYHYAIPHYPFTYPVCLYSVDLSVFSSYDIYYYNERNSLEEFDFSTVKITIGSLLDTNNIVINDNPRETFKLFDSLYLNPSLPECNFMYKRTDIKDNTAYYKQNKNIKYNFALIEKVYYNGMLIETEITKLFHDIDKFKLTVNPLYAKITDTDNSASIDMKKTQLYRGKSYDKLTEVCSFFFMMLPLVVKKKYLDEILQKYPIADVIAREISYAEFKQEKNNHDKFITTPIGDIPINAVGYLYIPRKKQSDFAFEYDPDTCITEDGLCGCMSKTIIEWLVVSEGYQQDFKIPNDIKERRKKYHKAFSELNKYLHDNF
jgi:hypothetical protein